MVLLKKLVIAPIFLIIFGLLTYQLTPLLQSYDFVFSLSSSTFITLLFISLITLLSCLLFTLLVTLASDWRITLPVSVLTSLTPLLFIETGLAIVFSVLIFASFLLINFILENSLKSYLTFQPASLLGPSIKHLSTFLILSFCFIYFLSSTKLIAQKGFEIPDALIDSALSMMPLNTPTEQNSTNLQVSNISTEQIEALQQNPDLLKQFGLDPKILNELTNPNKITQTPQQLSNNLIKQTVKDQIENIIKPYTAFIPAILTLILFLTLQSLVSLLNLLIYPLLWLIFLIFEKTGFTKFTTEMRPVKKLVIE